MAWALVLLTAFPVVRSELYGTAKGTKHQSVQVGKGIPLHGASAAAGNHSEATLAASVATGIRSSGGASRSTNLRRTSTDFKSTAAHSVAAPAPVAGPLTSPAASPVPFVPNTLDEHKDHVLDNRIQRSLQKAERYLSHADHLTAKAEHNLAWAENDKAAMKEWEVKVNATKEIYHEAKEEHEEARENHIKAKRAMRKFAKENRPVEVGGKK